MTGLPMTETGATPVLGWTGFVLGAVALVGAVIVFWAGPFAPPQDLSVSIGELATDTAKAALRSAAGLEQPAPELVTRTIDDYLQIVIAGLGSLAVVLAVASFVKREPRRIALGAAILGGSAIAFQMFVWAVAVIFLAIVFYAIMTNFGEILGGLFGG